MGELAEILSGRRVGNTTRHIDVLIQELFMKGSATFIDHGKTPIATKLMARTLRERLKYEHGQKVKIVFAGQITAKAILIYDKLEGWN